MNNDIMTPGRTMNLTQAAKYSGFSTYVLRELMSEGKLRHVRHHTRKILIKAQWLDDLLELMADETMQRLEAEGNCHESKM